MRILSIVRKLTGLGAPPPSALPLPSQPAPLSDEARREKARAIRVHDDASFQAFLALYDEQKDAASADWQNLLGLHYGNPAHSQYDLKRSHEYLLSAANQGHAGAAYNLARYWATGVLGPIEPELAKYWFQRAFENGNTMAGSRCHNSSDTSR
jgi:TPR repeat protein